MNEKKQSISIISLMFKCIVMLVILVSVTFSWFVFTKDGGIKTIFTDVMKAGSVTISPDGETWGSKLEFNLESGNLNITEYSGNGLNLYVPVISKNQISGYYLPNEDGFMSKKGYIEASAYIKTDIPIHLYLSQDCSVNPVDDKVAADYIAGAIRIAIWVEGEEPIIWAPNSTYEFSNGSVNANGTPESFYSYVSSNSEEQYVDSDQLVIINNPDLKESGVSDDKRFVWGNLKDIENYEYSVEPIFSTEKDLKEEIEKQIVIRVWVEGTDREAVKEMLGGKFTIDLRFKAIGNN